MIDCYGFHTRDISLPEPEERYSEDERETYEAPYREPQVIPQTPQNRAWRQRLDDACKEAR